MNLQQLAIFREVIKTGSVSQAARNMGRTQPAISASLKALEESLNMTLFKREGRRLSPLPEAQYLLSEANEVLERLQTAEQNLTNMRDRVKGSLKIVAMPGPSAYLLPVFISKFIENRPDVNVSLVTRSTPQVRNLISAQAFDIGVCDISGANPEAKLYQTEVIPCHCLCAVSQTHPLARKDRISVQDLSGQAMGLLQAGHVTAVATQKAFEASGATFNLRVDAQYFLQLLNFVEAGQICVVLDPLSAQSYLQSQGQNGKIVFRPFTPDIHFGYEILTPHHRPLSLLATDFLQAWKAWMQGTINKLSDGNL
ncbi:MAG: LysR family transcriptional regulator [Halocynthiibacter sp.]